MRASKKKQEPPLPRPFELPQNFQFSVLEGLLNKNLTGKSRSKFITAIAGAIFHHKSYPTRDEYDHVTRQVFSKWPFLQARNGDVRCTVILSLYTAL